MRLLIFIILLFYISVSLTNAQNYVVSGYVEDLKTGERVIGAFIVDSVRNKVVQTNNFGFFSLKCSAGNIVLFSSFVGYKPETSHISLHRDTMLLLKIDPVQEIKEVIIQASSYIHDINSNLGLTVIPVKQLTSIPALGQADILKAIQLQPGIKGGIEGSSGIFVRGGGAGENLFLIDDVPVYNVSHLYGFFSTFNSSAVKDVKVIKGCFPAMYGGRTSSVIDVRSRDGNNKSLKGEVSIGLISSSATLEGPLGNDKTTFMISGRRS